MDQPTALISQLPTWSREPGAQPIPGYRLIEPLGRGGYGEVWKCEAPGGLFKAVKFVFNRDEQGGPATQEQQALQRVKAIRHPFILSLERVETVDGVLVIIMELADKSLFGLLGDYQLRNQTGIPREELLGYLLEAAEALDWMNFGHGLQHLDIKPHNLFLVSNHLKVADFGLVDRFTEVERTHPTQRQGGVTPLYAAPELLRGTVSRHCDQYSLAIVYQQLLTGTVPFWCPNMYQLMMLHMTAEPNLTPLPREDRSAIARALSKQPDKRFPSCLDFLQALVCGEEGNKPSLPRHAAVVKRLLSSLRAAEKPIETVQPAEPPSPPPPDPGRPTPGVCPTVPTGDKGEAEAPATDRVPIVPRAESSTGITTPPQRGPSYAATCVSLPGYRFLQCIAHTALGAVWKVEDEEGRARRALCLDNFVEHDVALIERLQGMKHPALPATEVAWSPSRRLVLVTEEFEHTLRDRLEACQKEGLPGIPREELLRHLRSVAETLDALYEQHNLPHLGLNPRTLMLQGESVRVMDFGLIPLVWMPTGQTAGSLNGRYAAPELFDRPDLTGVPPGEATWAALMGRAGPASDQYSLALIYAELLNGIPPNAPRSNSSLHRRPTGSRRSRGDSGAIVVRGQPRLDLSLLPSCDAALLQRALHDSPEKRFPTCTALVEALEKAASTTARLANLYYRLPAVIPFASLQGEPPPRDVVLPALSQVVLNLAAPGLGNAGLPRSFVHSSNLRYVLQEGNVWECKCPLQIFRGALALKVQGFREEWRARIAQESSEAFTFHLEFPSLPRPGSREKVPPSRLAFELTVQSEPTSTKYYAEAHMRVRPVEGDPQRLAQLVPELAPRLFDSMRRYLHASPEQRSEDRWQCPQPLHVYPILRDLELDEILEGISRNISMGGVSFRVATAPRTEQVYLHWHKSAMVSPYAVLARIKRVQPMPGGGYEVGAAFVTAS